MLHSFIILTFISFTLFSNILSAQPTLSKTECLFTNPSGDLVDTFKTAKTDSNKISERRDFNLHRLFLLPTARPLKTGEGYVSLSELFLTFAAFGIEEVFIIGGGISIFPDKNPNQLYYFSPKITPIHTDNFSFSSGIFLCNYTNNFEAKSIFDKSIGIIYSIGTYGDEEKSITAGLGWNYWGTTTREKPILILGGDLRLKGNVKIVTENWIFLNTEYTIGMTGFRFIGKHFTGDLAVIHPYSKRNFFIVPWFSIIYNFDLFGKRNY